MPRPMDPLYDDDAPSAEAPARAAGLLVRAAIGLGIGVLVLIGWSGASSATADHEAGLPPALTDGGTSPTTGIIAPPNVAVPPVPLPPGTPQLPPAPVGVPPLPPPPVPVPPSGAPVPPGVPVPPVGVPVPPVSEVLDQAALPPTAPPGTPPVGLPGGGAPELPTQPGLPPVPPFPQDGPLVPPAMPGLDPLDRVAGPIDGLPSVLAPIGQQLGSADHGVPPAAATSMGRTVGGAAPVLVESLRASLVGLRPGPSLVSADLVAPAPDSVPAGPTGPSGTATLPPCGATSSADRAPNAGPAPVTITPRDVAPERRASSAVDDGLLGCSSIARARPPVAPD